MGTKGSSVNYRQKPEHNDTLWKVVSTLSNTILLELSIEQLEGSGPELIGLEMETCLWSDRATYSITKNTVRSKVRWERTQGRRPAKCELPVSGLNGRSQIEERLVDWVSSIAKDDGLLDDITSASSTLLPDAKKEGIPIVQDEMKSDWQVYDADLSDFLELHEDLASNPPVEEVALVLADLLYKTRSYRNSDSCSQVVFMRGDMSWFLELECTIMAAGAKGHIFSSWMQFLEWYKSWFLCRKKCLLLKLIQKLRYAWAGQ